MAFALTSFVADGVRYMGPSPYRAKQTYFLTLTGAATDVALDLGNATGTFWTAATGDASYGTMATQVLAQITSWVDNYQAVDHLFVPEVYDRIQVASSPTGTQYAASIGALLLPSIEFAASGGETTYTVSVTYQLDSNRLPNNASYNVA